MKHVFMTAENFADFFNTKDFSFYEINLDDGKNIKMRKTIFTEMSKKNGEYYFQCGKFTSFKLKCISSIGIEGVVYYIINEKG